MVSVWLSVSLNVCLWFWWQKWHQRSRFYFFSFSRFHQRWKWKVPRGTLAECRSTFLAFSSLFIINENMKYAKVSLILLKLLLPLLLLPIPLEAPALASSLINNKLFKKQHSFFSCHCTAFSIQFRQRKYSYFSFSFISANLRLYSFVMCFSCIYQKMRFF